MARVNEGAASGLVGHVDVSGQEPQTSGGQSEGVREREKTQRARGQRTAFVQGWAGLQGGTALSKAGV